MSQSEVPAATSVPTSRPIPDTSPAPPKPPIRPDTTPEPAAPKPPVGSNSSIEHQVIRDLSSLGHFLFVHAGGRSGKQRVLSHLYHFGGRLPQRQMVEHAGITPAALSEVLAKLECEGLVVRTRSEQDRRQLDVVLTPKGVKRARQTVRWQEIFEEESLAVLSDAEKSQLKGMLDQLVEHWDTIEKTRCIEARLSECAAAPASPDAAPQDPTPNNPNPTTMKGA